MPSIEKQPDRMPALRTDLSENPNGHDIILPAGQGPVLSEPSVRKTGAAPRGVARFVLRLILGAFGFIFGIVHFIVLLVGVSTILIGGFTGWLVSSQENQTLLIEKTLSLLDNHGETIAAAGKSMGLEDLISKAVERAHRAHRVESAKRPN